MSRSPVGPLSLSRLAFAACVLLLAVLVVPPVRALAALPEGVWPVSSAKVLLGHGEAYTLDGAGRTHSGIDIAAEEGEVVAAGLSGQVSFVGRVPAAGSETVLAVTVLAGDLKLTFLPLASASVSRGDSVGAGDTLGSLAGTGDASSANGHVHVSVRRGETYLDPLSVLSAPPSEVAPDAGSQPEAASEARQSPSGPAQPAPKAAAPPRPAAAPAVPAVPATGRASTAGGPAAATVEPEVQPADRAPAVTAIVAARPSAGLAPAVGTGSAVLAGQGVAPSHDAAKVSSGTGGEGMLLRIGRMPAVGLRLPGVPESVLGALASLMLRVGLGRRAAGQRVALGESAAVAVPCRERG